MSPHRLFKKEYAQELVKVAEEDLESARILKDGQVKRKENVLFHVQQCIEKCLKACICHAEKPVPLVHDLNELVKVIPNYQQVPYHDQIYDLTQFATIRRYEEGIVVLTEEELEASLTVGEEILKWSQSYISK